MEMKGTLRRPSEGCRRTALAAGGFACVYSVAIVFFYCDWLFDLPGADPLAYAVCLNGCLCLAAAAVFALSRRGRRPGRAAVAAGTAAYAAALALVAASAAQGSAPLSYAAGAAAGAGAGLLVPLWFDRAGLLDEGRFAYVLGFGSLASAPLALALDLLPAAGMAAVCLALVAASSALLARLDRADDADPSGEAPAEREAARGIAAPLAYVLLLSFAYGVLDVVAMANPLVDAPASGFASQVGGIAADVAFLLYVRFDGKRYAALLNVALAVIATGLLFLPFLQGVYSVALVTFTHLGWSIALLVAYALVVERFRARRALLGGWAALAFAAPRPFVVAGSFAASAVAVDNRFAFAQMTMVAFALLYLILLGAWLLRTREKRAAERAIRKRDELIKRYVRARDEVQALACDELARERGLTNREAEILRLLAQGRDAAHIEQALFLSRNTVKSYTRSLYAKLDVHSKQEVIDLVKDHLELDSVNF